MRRLTKSFHLLLACQLALSLLVLGGCKLDDNRLKGSIRGLPSGEPPPGAPPPGDPPALPSLSFSPEPHYYSQDSLSLGPSLEDPLNLIESFSISPGLPEGLHFDSTTGEISGSLPPLPRSTYTISVHTAYGIVSYDIELEAHYRAVVTSNADESDTDLEDGICDSDPGEDIVCTLRAALEQANHFKPLPARIELPNLDFELNGTELLIETNMELIGAGPSETIIRQTTGATQRVLNIRDSEEVNSFLIEGVTIRDGNNGGVGVFDSVSGGGVYLLLGNQTQLTLRNCELLDNMASGFSGFGGAIYIASPLGTTAERHMLIENCRIEGNSAFNYGGGISWFNSGPGHLQIINSLLKANEVPCCVYSGSALYMNGKGRITLDSSEVLNNMGSAALYIQYHSNLIRIQNSTIANNGASGLYLRQVHEGPAEIINSTFSENSGPAIYGRRQSPYSSFPMSIINSSFQSHGTHLQLTDGVDLTLANSVFANASTANCTISGGSTVTSLGGNVAQGANTCLLDTAIDLASTNPLFDAGGLKYQNAEDLTQTIALQETSPARGFGVEAYCPEKDQIGQDRPSEGSCDSGALEYQD